MPAAGAAAWAGGLLALLAPLRVALWVAILALLALLALLVATAVRREAGARGIVRAAAAWLVVAAAVGGTALLRDADVAAGPVAALAPSRARTATVLPRRTPRHVSSPITSTGARVWIRRPPASSSRTLPSSITRSP